MYHERNFHVRRATENDLPSIRRIISHSREQATLHLHDLLSVERSEHCQVDDLKACITDRDTAFFIANKLHDEPAAVLWCRHVKGAPAVYRPGRSALSVKAFYISEGEMITVGHLLLDAAIEWATNLSPTGEIFASAITWTHDVAMQEVRQHYHVRSNLVELERYRELFTIEGEHARMRPVTEWYFGRSPDVLSSLLPEGHKFGAVRPATESDLPRMVELSRQKRHDYARYQPVFWRPAEDAEAKQLDFFRWLIQQDAPLLFVSEESDTSLNGFVIALNMERLPLSDPALRLPNGLHIDDFTVARDELWATTGRALLVAAVAAHQSRVGADSVINVISGTHDQSKRELLEQRANMRSLFTWDILPAGNLYNGQDT